MPVQEQYVSAGSQARFIGKGGSTPRFWGTICCKGGNGFKSFSSLTAFTYIYWCLNYISISQRFYIMAGNIESCFKCIQACVTSNMSVRSVRLSVARTHTA